LERPIEGAAGGQLLIGVLPEELAVGFAEAHQHAAVPWLFGIADQLVVGSHVDLAARHYGVAVALGAQFRHPLDVFLGFDIPRNGNAGHRRGHVAVRCATPHRPVTVAWVGGKEQQ